MTSPLDLAEAVRRQGIQSARILDAFHSVRRADFVPRPWQGFADADEPIPIAHGQVTTQPTLIAEMLAALRLEGNERALEIGTGLGFQTALLARLCANVVSIE